MITGLFEKIKKSYLFQKYCQFSRNPIFAISIFLIFFLVNYSYFLFYYNVPGINPDTIQYISAYTKIVDFDIPLIDMPVDIPLGYPIFLSILSIFGDVLFLTPYIQVIIFLLATIVIIYNLSKINHLLGQVGALFLCFWACDPSIMAQNTSLYPDSLYSSLIVIVTASLLFYLRTKSLNHLILLVAAVTICSFIRSNGIYIFFIPLALLLFSLLNKNYKRAKHITLLTIASLLLISSINFILKSYFFPADYNRIQYVYSRLVGNQTAYNNEIEVDSTCQETYIFIVPNTTLDSKPVLFKKYLFSTTEERASFYYSILPVRYEKLVESINTLNSGAKCNHEFNKLHSPENRKLKISNVFNSIIKDTYIPDYKNRKIVEKTNYNNKYQAPVMLFSHLFYKISWLFLHKYKLITILYLLTTLIIIIKCFNFKSKQFFTWFSLAIISLIHFSSLIVLTFAHSRIQIRYVNVTEFIMYLTIIFTIYLLIKKEPIFYDNKA